MTTPQMTTPQISNQLMQNYLLNLFLQQACVPGMTGLPPSSLAQLLTGQTGFNFPFAAPQPDTTANPVPPHPTGVAQPPVAPQPPQTSSTCHHNPVKPVDSVRPTNPVPPLNSLSSCDSTDQTLPTRHTPTKNKSTLIAESEGEKPEEKEEEEEKEERKQSYLPKMKIKKLGLGHQKFSTS